ncbi:hypothetical protein [Paenibacillus sp. GCM10012306]|uniref:hypothetical protein n=1 Tax=Paenibacillus sp. GCM10012306 TaxID=3317342 RepID=UPI00361080A7
MPRIERIRITGLKYEKMLKKYDDMVLDLCNEEGPANTLITLMNGGGKGVLLQSIFQLLIPKTPWGKDSENQVEAFFHNHKKQLKPYTFHVAIEWRLDNSERNEYITTGIAMTAHNSLDQQDIKVDYLLYALLEYGEGAELNLSTLPLYDETTREPADFETIQQLVRERRNEILPFGSHSSDMKRYYDFLAVRDIHIAEWRNMRRINGEEGGIKGYFKKHDAFTNHNVFEKLIIPEIGASLNEGLKEDDNSLQRMFIDAATVAQRLPMLEQREQAYTEFLGMAGPLYDLVEQGTAADEAVQETELLGRQMFTVIHEELNSTEAERRRIADELAGHHQEADQLRFEGDNLKYLRSKDELETKQAEFNTLSDHQNRARTRLTDSKEMEKKLEIAYSLAKRKLQISQIEQWQKEIQAIEGSMEMKERQEVIQETKENLRQQWDVVARLWQQTLSGFAASLHSLTGEEETLRKERDESLRELATLDVMINDLTSTIRKYSEDMGTFAAKYGSEAAHAPGPALQRSLATVQELEETNALLKEQVRAAEEQRLTLHTTHTRLSEQFAANERDTGELSVLLDTQNQRESQLWSQLVVLLELYEEHSQLGTTALYEVKEAITARFLHRIEETGQQNKRLRRDYYHQLLDVELQNQSYWVPNGDILTVKDMLDNLKIQSVAGSCYLNDLPYLAREEELERYPLLPYALILTKREAEKIQPDMLKEVLLKSPVPLFIREDMAAMDSPALMLLASEGPQMVLQPERFMNWKNGITAKLKEREQELQDGEAYLSKLRSARQEYERLFQLDNTLVLRTKLDALTLLDQELRQKIGQLNAELQDHEDLILRLSREIAEGSTAILEQQQRQLALQSWIERTRAQEEARQEKQKVVDRKGVLVRELAARDQQLLQLAGQRENMAGQREKWMGDTRYSLFPRLQHWFPELVFPVDQPAPQLTENTAPTAETVDPAEQNTLLELLSTVEALQQSLSRSELDIRTRGAQITAARENLNELEATLGGIDIGWRSAPEPVDSADSLMAARVRQKADTAMLEEDYQQIHDDYIRCQTVTDSLLKELSKAEKAIKMKHERPIEIWTEGLDYKEQEISQRIQDNERLFGQCKRNLERTDRLIQTLSNQRQIMNAHIEERVNLRDIPEEVKQRVQESCETFVSQWLLQIKQRRDKRAEISKRVKEEKNALSSRLSKSGWNAELETKIQDRLNTVHWDDFHIARQVLDSMLRSSRDQIESIQSDKEGMELSRKLWVGRAAKRVIQIVDIMKRMERRMIIHNENQHAFPLVKLSYKNINVPRATDDVEPLVTDYFNHCIQDLLKKYPRMEQVPAAAIKEIINDGRIVYAAFQNRFPVLQVYKPVTENYFLYAAPEEYHYSDWEVINRGALDEAVGSGGQRQSVQLLVAMMIMTHKRVNRENKGWTVFLYDNPFGEMVSNNVLDPVFEISKALRFQWLIVTPPELVKNDVSIRFGVYWQLYFGGIKGDMLESTLVKGGRKLVPSALF